ncbi:hypothetical protein PCANC_27590 [Puccinia coronata f. sp. avenae]|nr:hypothetical protein PCANC_27590 [Puccinia coronata f. sp. avenae]
MDQNQTVQALQAQLAEIQRNLATQNEIIANLSANQQRPPHTSRDTMAEYLMKKFIKSPVAVFNEVNPRKPTLAFDGSNWFEWESAVNRTLQHAFLSDKSFVGDEDLFSVMNLVQNQAVTSLMRNTLDSALLSIVESGEVTSSKDLFMLLKSKCKRSGRRHKLILVEKILKFASDRQPASESWLARFCGLMSDIERSKITVDELGGLLLQSMATAPPGANQKNFEYSIAQPLDDMTSIPTFGQVTTLIQSALSKVKAPTSLPPGSIPSDVEMSVQAMRHAPRYTAPHRRIENHPNPSAQQANTNKFSIEKATFYQGKPPNDSLKAKHGWTCLYCKELGHWYADCKLYWQDVRHGYVNAPPPNHADQDSKFVPPAQQAPPVNTNGRLRKIDIPEATDGTVLLDSGSTINVVVFHSRSNAKEVHFIYYKLTYKMYTRVGYKRRKIREEYRRNPEEYTIHQHHRINNKEELHQQQAGNTDDGSSTRSGHRGKKGKKDQEEERPRP